MTTTPLSPAELRERHVYLGDAVYAEFEDSGIIWLRLNDHRSERLIALEPEVLQALVNQAVLRELLSAPAAPRERERTPEEHRATKIISALRMELGGGVSETTNAALTVEEFDEKTEQLRLLEAVQTVTDERDQWRDEALRFKAHADRAEEELAARPVWDAKRREWMARYLAATLASGGPNDRLFKVDLQKWIKDVHDAFEDVGTVPLAPSTSGGR